MKNIMQHLEAFNEFEIIIFGNEVILNEPVDKWPICDCLISFFSSGFPLNKAEEYAQLRKPFLLNDIVFQKNLLNREKVYTILEQNGIPTPRHVIYHDSIEYPEYKQTLIEHEDSIEVDGVKIQKPFVEKPLDAEDHNIYLYYPKSAGGGSKRLFRKVENRSSEFYPNIHNIRNGSYIYEQFLPTEGTDVKVYTVGADYAHAEARRSPVVDGRVKRDAEGKEVRYPVILTPQEKEMARKVVLAFKQRVCGFDLLRTGNESFVCDVNGWSFVKNSVQYYNDAAQILRVLMLRAVAPTQLSRIPLVRPIISAIPKAQRLSQTIAAPQPTDERPARSGSPGSEEELRCVVAVVRHGDRTPKQKLKIKVSDKAYLSLFEKYGQKREALKLKTAVMLQDVLDITRHILTLYQDDPNYMGDPYDVESREEKIEKLMQMKSVLERGGGFSGINRKVQLKPLKWDAPTFSTDELQSKLKLFSPLRPAVSPPVYSPNISQPGTPATGGTVPIPSHLPGSASQNPLRRSTTQEGFPRFDLATPTVSAPSSPTRDPERVVQALLILKWGGELTHTGRQQAMEMGTRLLADMYPSEDGFLQLHSTYRHDLKIYASDEGRVEMTAAAYTKGLLNLEGELTPILVSLVQHTDKLLEKMSFTVDPESVLANEKWDEVKDRLHSFMHSDKNVDEEFIKQAVPTGAAPLVAALKAIGNPMESLRKVYNLVLQLISEIERKWSHAERNQLQLCQGELLSGMLDRWRKLAHEFHQKEKFDTRKVPDIYDCIKYDYLHNQEQLKLETAAALYNAIRPLANFINPQEYGTTIEEKLDLGVRVARPLMRKILYDLRLARDQGITSEQLYFPGATSLRGRSGMSAQVQANPKPSRSHRKGKKGKKIKNKNKIKIIET
eukprot:Phypoly_transcript_01327.p1 GENE.Phypoly_transcript_01327~~Phypoly_transcript_01327.p1  ORF type:complete len:930 (+),score=150.02 Phypoly_transcript_01327:110-2791(+)